YSTSIWIANAYPCRSRPLKKTHGRSSPAPTLWVRSYRARSRSLYHSVHSFASKMVSKASYTSPSWLTATLIPPSRLYRSTKSCTSRSSTSISNVVVSLCRSSRPTKVLTQKAPTSTQPSTVWLPTTTKTATTRTHKASIMKPTNGLKDSKKHAPHGSSSTLTLRPAGKPTRNRLPATCPRQKKPQHPVQQKLLVVPLHTPPRTKKPLLKMQAPWLPTKHLPHCVKN